MNIPYWLRPLAWEMKKSMVVLKWVAIAYLVVGTLAMLMVAGWLLLTW